MFLAKDLIKVIGDIGRKSFWLGKWGQSLNFPMFFGPLFFYEKTVVWVIFFCNLVAVLTAAQIHKKAPFSRFTSICHIAWFPMLYLMARAIMDPMNSIYFDSWLYYVSVTVIISLVLDVFNLFKYFNGDRSQIG